MAFTLCSSQAIIAKAGAQANSDAVASLALLTQYSEEAEAEIMAITRKDWTTDYAGLDSGVSAILDMYCSCHGGSNLINYDMGGYTSREEARLMLNFLDQRMKVAASLLRDKKVETFIDGA